MENTLNCFLCQNQVVGGLDGLSSHLRRTHRISLSEGIPGTGFVCAQNDCQRSFIDFYNLRRHIRNDHLAPRRNVDQVREELQQVEHGLACDRMEVEGDRGVNAVIDSLADDRNIMLQQQNQLEAEVDLTASAVRMIARFQAHGSMTGAMMTNILDESENFVAEAQNNIQARVMACLQPGQVISQDMIQQISAAIQFESPFVGLKSLPQQMKALTRYCNHIESIGIPLGYRLDSVFDKTTCSYVPDLVLESFQYVQIIRVLAMVLSSPEVREAIESEEPSEDGIYGSFLDGAHYASHAFLQLHRRAIRLKIYLDDVEIVGPLGSKTGVHKLTVFYFQIDNLPDHMNSELSSIHVLLICSAEDVKKYGYAKILAPFLDDLEKLESDEGVELVIDGEIYVLRATVIVLCGDGLAIHDIYNLLGPSAFLFCRLCIYSREDLHAGSLEKAPERTEELYEQQYNQLRENNFSELAKTLTGLRGETDFKSRYFHISRNKIFDIMHEFLEGINPMTVKAVLHRYIVVEKRFDIQYLNNQIYSFDYGFLEQTNKPSANFTVSMLTRDGHGLSQKAMQMWLLTRAMPFILAEKVKEDDEYMEQILQLLRIMETVFAPRVPASFLPYLEAITDGFNCSFLDNFPHINWINRNHQIGHLAECLRYTGSLLDFWCMRFEAKHAELKLRAQNVHNFINPPKTLIRVCQCVQSSVWGAGDVQLQRLTASGPKKMVGILLSKNHLRDLGFGDEDLVHAPGTVSVNGTEYRRGLIVVLEKTSQRVDNLLLFGRIEEVVVLLANRRRAFLLTSVCTTLFLDPSLNAYRIDVNDVGDMSRFLDVADLATYKPYSIWKKPNSDASYVSLRNIVE